MDKNTRRFFSSLFPRGRMKEYIKLLYYNFNSPSGVKFKLKSDLRYTTIIDRIEFTTRQPPYHAVKDMIKYQFFYTVKDGDFVLDAGANVGQLAVYFAKQVGSDGQIYSFEPDRYNVEMLKQNILLNDLQEIVSINEYLLWNKNTLLEFYEAGTPGSSAHWKPDPTKIVKKQAITIDEWVQQNNLSKLNFVKMDIEGAEIEALQGCVNTLEQFSPHFAIASYHIVDGAKTYLWIEDFFKSHNYPVKTIPFGREVITFAGKDILQ